MNEGVVDSISIPFLRVEERSPEEVVGVVDSSSEPFLLVEERSLSSPILGVGWKLAAQETHSDLRIESSVLGSADFDRSLTASSLRVVVVVVVLGFSVISVDIFVDGGADVAGGSVMVVGAAVVSVIVSVPGGLVGVGNCVFCGTVVVVGGVVVAGAVVSVVIGAVVGVVIFVSFSKVFFSGSDCFSPISSNLLSVSSFTWSLAASIEGWSER